MKSKIVNYIIGFIFVVYGAVSIWNTYLQTVFHKNGWYLGEWLINYQDGGFKRRGLFGTGFIFINELTGIRLEYLVFTFVSVLYIWLFWLLIKLFCQKNNTLLTISLLLMPAGMGMVLKDPTIAAKKEVLLFLLYLIYFLSVQSKKRVKNWVLTLFIVITILNHEAAFFYLPFLSFTYFVHNNDNAANKIKNILIYQIIPAGVMMLILYKFGFSIRTDNSILFLKNHGLTLGQAGIYDYDPNYNVLNFYKARIYAYQTYLISLFLASLTFIIYFRFNKISINKWFIIIQILFLIPLFYIAYDWGRWINIFFTLLTIWLIGEKQLGTTLKKDGIAVGIILFNSLWSMMLLNSGFVTFPAVDALIKRLYYFIYFKIANLF